MASVAQMYGDEAMVENTAEFISVFLDTRFTGLTDELRLILTEVCLEMFEAGAAWADTTAGRVGGQQIITELAH